MPTVDVEYRELEKLIDLKTCRAKFGNPENLDVEKLDEVISLVKAEVKEYNKNEAIISVEMKDTNRADLWSAEGLARGLRCYLGLERGFRKYSAGEPAVEVNVDAKLANIRPFIACSVLKDIHLTDPVIRGLMHLQDKLDQTCGRNRRKASIGIYNFHLIKPPIEYAAVKPADVSFVPLGFDEKMGLNEILERHPKGVEYGHIVKKNPLYPMLFDSEGKILSFPPIINSNDLGKITEESRSLLVEVTGTSHKTVLNTLNLVTAALIDRGGKAYSATILYPEGSEYQQVKAITPDFSSRTVPLGVEYTNKLLGLKLSAKRVGELLLTAGLGVSGVQAENVDVIVPSYRVDVMHQVDLIEDIAIAYGYNNIECLWREMPTTGRAKPDQRKIDIARELMVGLGYQEVLTYMLTNKENLFSKMNTKETENVEVANPKVANMTCLRNWLLPSLMEFLSNNQSVEFPQKIFEVGKVTQPDEANETKTRDEDWLSAATTHANANFTEIKSALDAFTNNFGVEWQIKETAHPSFIEGRAGRIVINGVDVGIVGEINPAVLEAWKLENPVAAFEINLQKILTERQGAPVEK
ncbi:MAG TPA: phenylalanine--tRNA ligase subunit beta [Candidatus Limnocylindrales bacterium]|nr:phenylalanine--tRNA ligase subunit beta [Candidatus Limnocylindrales bacterium]